MRKGTVREAAGPAGAVGTGATANLFLFYSGTFLFRWNRIGIEVTLTGTYSYSTRNLFLFLE